MLAGFAHFPKRSRLIIMRTPALCKSLSFKRLSLAAAVVSSVLAGPVAMAERPNDSIYLGMSYGLQIRDSCNGAAVCSRGSSAGKATLGYHVSPSWAYEINYFGMNTQRRAWDTGPVVTDSVRSQALGIGFSLDTELWGVMTNHLRGGIAGTHNRIREERSNGTIIAEVDREIIPYVGVGMSFLVAPHFRIQTGVDILIKNRDQNNYLATVGATAEF